MPQIANPQDIQLILWDIDGTLLMPKGVGRAATRLAMLEVFNTDAGLETHYFGGKTDWRTLLDLLPSQGFTEAAIQESLPAYAQSVAQHMSRIIVDYPVEQCPGAHALVTELHRMGHPLQGLVTGNTVSIAPIKLHAGGFDPDWFVVGAYIMYGDSPWELQNMHLTMLLSVYSAVTCLSKDSRSFFFFIILFLAKCACWWLV